MNLLFLYISAERNNTSLNREIYNGIKAVKEEAISSNYSDLIKISSLSAIENDDKDDIDCAINETLYDWLKGEDVPEDDRKTSTPPKEEETNLNDFCKLAEYLHSFADKNCENAFTSVYFIWCVQNYIPCPSEVVEFYGSLKRFQSWHNAQMFVVTKNFESIEDWIPFLPFQIVASSREVIKGAFSTLWNGTLSVTMNGKANVSLFPNVALISENNNFNVFNFLNNKSVESPYILPTAELFAEVDLETIPWAFIQRGSLSYLKVCTSHNISGEDKNSAMEVLTKFTSNERVGTLLRIRYSYKPPTLKGLDATNTEVWKQNIAEGNFDSSPASVYEGQHETIVFLLLSKETGSNVFRCIALQDPTSYGEDIVRLIYQEELKSVNENEENKLKVINMLRDTPELSKVQVAAFSYLLMNFSKKLRTKFQKKFNIEDMPDESKHELECRASKEILSYIFSAGIYKAKLYSVEKELVPETCLQKEQWPEFEVLEDIERKNRSTSLCSSDFLCGLPPPVVSQSTGLMDASEILKYYREKNVINEKYPQKSTARENKLGWIRNASWNNVLHQKYHGVYYNNGDPQENQEFKCNQLRKQMIRNETLSTCTIFYKKEVPFSHGKKPRVPSKIETKKPPTTHRLLNDSDSCSSRSFRLKDKLPLRRSPRTKSKGKIDALKPSDLLSSDLVKPRAKPSSTNSKRMPKPVDLSDIHKQKLRNVILIALEQEGVKMKHELFKLCFKKLFMVCKPFALDVVGQGETTKNFEKIAKSHVKQVVEFERRKYSKKRS